MVKPAVTRAGSTKTGGDVNELLIDAQSLSGRALAF